MHLMLALAALFAGLALGVLGLGHVMHAAKATAPPEVVDAAPDTQRAASSYWYGRLH